MFGRLFNKSTNYKETRVSQGYYKETSDKCLGLATLMAIEQLKDPNFNPFSSTNNRKRAAEIQDDINAKLRANPCLRLECGLRFAKEIIAKAGYHTEPKLHQTSDLVEKKEFLENIQKQTEADGITRSVVMGHFIREPTAKTNGIGHAIYFGTRLNKDAIHCSGMDSNFFISHGDGSEGCKRVIGELIRISGLYNKMNTSAVEVIAKDEKIVDTENKIHGLCINALNPFS